VAYQVVPLDGKAASALRVGQNTLAAHCRQTRGGQFIDVGIVLISERPERNAALRSRDGDDAENADRNGTTRGLEQRRYRTIEENVR
jgi:hypothetical protein